MIKKKLIILGIAIFALIVVLSLVNAEETTNVKLKVAKAYNLSIILNILDPDEHTAIKSFQEFSNYLEELNFEYNSSTKETATFSAMALGTGIVIKKKYFGNYSTGTSLVFELFDASDGMGTSSLSNSSAGSAQNIINTSTSNTSVNLVNTTNTASGNKLVIETNASKFSFSNLNIDWKKAMKYGGYGLGAIILLAIVIFVTIFILKKIKTSSSGSISPFGSKEFNPKKSSTFSKKEDFVLNSTRPSSRIEKELEEAQRKIREAQQTIEDIRGRKQKVIEAERKFEEAKRELERLKDE